MSEWQQTTIGEVVTLQRGVDITRAQQMQGNVPVVSSSGPTSWHDTAISEGPGVIIGRKGVINSAYYVDGPFWPHDTTLWVKDFKGNDPRFVYYFFVNLDVSGLDVGSANPTLNRNHVHPLPTLWPQAAEQRAIAEVLGALDDKISVNIETAEISAELASAIYEYFSRSSSWTDRTLADAGSWQSGGTPATGNPAYWGGDIPWISAASLRSSWIESSDRCVTLEGAASGTRLVPEGTIIFVVRGMSLKSEFRVGLTQREVAFGQDCKAIRPVNGLSPHVLLHGLLSQRREILELVDEAGHGTGRLATDRISGLSIRVPCADVDPAVDEIEALDERAAALQRESACLAGLRDFLLPKLMSGEIRVRDAEKVVEDVT
jgi:type I restriction enzyme S subunit